MTLWVFLALAIGGILLFGVRIHGIPLTGPMYKKGMPLVDWRHSKRDIFKIIYARGVRYSYTFHVFNGKGDLMDRCYGS